MNIPQSHATSIPRLDERDLSSTASASQSAVSWGAILAGAAGAAALSLILLVLGAGLGLSSVSPWSSQGIGAVAFGASTIIWLTITQLAASGIGGYLAGRLRTRWTAVHTDEVYFRDTAHGFLAWAVASIATAALLSSVVGAIVSGGAQTVASAAGGVATAGAATAASMGGPKGMDAGPQRPGRGTDPMAYFVDSLFRADASTTGAAGTTPVAAPTAAVNNGGPDRASASSAEAGTIIANALRSEALPPEDAKYLAQLVSQRTGISPTDAEKRVNDTFARLQTKLHETEAAARDAADKARKASAYASLWLAVSLFVGAFVASLSATYGGRRRDL